MDLPYDVDNPPAEPPSGVDQLLWTVAYALRAEHTPGPDGWCVAGICRGQSVLWPCENRKLADAGLLGSVGGGVPRPDRWRNYMTRFRPIRPRRDQPSADS